MERLRNTISDLEHKLERAKHHASDWKKEASELEKRNHYLAADLAHYVKLHEEAQSHLKDASQAQRSLALRDDEAAKLRLVVRLVSSFLHCGVAIHSSFVWIVRGWLPGSKKLACALHCIALHALALNEKPFPRKEAHFERGGAH